MVMPEPWHRLAVEALVQHVQDWSSKWDKNNIPKDTSERDGLESAILSELLGQEYMPHKDKLPWVQRALDSLGAPYHGHLGAGDEFAPVFDPKTGDFSFLGSEELNKFLDRSSFGGTPFGGVDTNPFGTPEEEEIAGKTKIACAQITAGQVVMGLGALVLTVGGLTKQPLVGALGVGIALVGAKYALEGTDEKTKLGQEQVNRARTGGGGGGTKTPSDPDGSLNEKTIAYHVPKQTVRDALREIESGKSGSEREVDLTKGQRAVLHTRWVFNKARQSFFFTLMFRGGPGSGWQEADDTRMAALDWLKRHLLVTAIKSDGSTSDGSNLLDNLGKKPEIPPKGYVVSSDYVDLGSNLQDVTVEFEVAGTA
jgi:hypothetical protein